MEEALADAVGIVGQRSSYSAIPSQLSLLGVLLYSISCLPEGDPIPVAFESLPEARRIVVLALSQHYPAFGSPRTLRLWNSSIFEL